MHRLIRKKTKQSASCRFTQVLLILFFGLFSCGENKAATECYNLENVLINHRDNRFAGTINKASELAKARQEKALADSLNAVELSDSDLKSRRNDIVSLLMQQHNFSLRASEIMTESGSLSSQLSAQYEAVTDERRPTDDEFFAQLNSLRIHCSLQ